MSETAGLTCTQVCGNANLACDAATMLENNDEIDTAAELVSLVSTLTGGNRCTRGANGNYGSNIDVPNIKTSGHCHFSSPERTLESVDCDGKHSPSFRLCWCSLSPPSPPPPSLPPPSPPPPPPTCLSVEGTNANLNGQYEHQSTATGIPIARYQKGEKGDCDWHYQDVGARSAIGVEACADACEAETLCEKFTYGEGNIGSGGRTSLGCRISTCGSDPGPSPCPSDGTCPLTLQWGGDVYTMATKAAASQHHYTRTDGSMVIRTGDGGWNFCAASGGVVVESCYGLHGRSGYVGDVQNQPAASAIYDWGQSGDSFISFGC